MQKVIHICDRCGSPYENSMKRKYEIYKEDEMFCMCLCDQCQMELEDWVDSKEVISNNPAKDVKLPRLFVKNIFD